MDSGGSHLLLNDDIVCKERSVEGHMELEEEQLETEKERMLYKALMSERAEKEELISRIRQIEEKIRIMEQEKRDCFNGETSKERAQYETDEDELKAETEWNLKKNRKKRKASVSPLVTPEKDIADSSKNKRKNRL